MIIHFEDTGEDMVIDDTNLSVLQHYTIGEGMHHILGGNSLEGREKTTYWMDMNKKEEYRLSCLEKIKNG